MVNQYVWIGIAVGVFFAGIAGGYAIFTNIYNPNTMFQNPQLVQQMMNDPQHMGAMMQNPLFAQQTLEHMRQDHQFAQDVIMPMMNDPELRKQMIGHMTENQEFMQEMMNASIMGNMTRRGMMMNNP